MQTLTKMKINCITKDGVKKNWWNKAWTIGAAGNGVYVPFREMMRDCKRYDTPTTGHYEAWDDYQNCLTACHDLQAIYKYETITSRYYMKTPATFRFIDQSRYPIDNNIDFEYYCTTVLPDKIGDREYLPITWTAYYKTCKYGADEVGMRKLQDFLNAIDRRKKWFTIVQWDDQILHDLSKLDVFVFAMGSPGDYQLPLICQPHAYTPPTNLKKDIFCSFVGRITHPVRSKIVEQLTGKDGYYISTKPHGLLQFCEILSRSRYVISSRGYGATSFRVCEGLQYGAHIINIDGLRPHDMEFDAIKEVRGDLFTGRNLHAVINSFDQNPSRNDAIALYKSHFTYEANKNLIIKALSNG